MAGRAPIAIEGLVMRLDAALILAVVCAGRAPAQMTTPAGQSAPANQTPVILPSLPKLPTLVPSPYNQNVRSLSDSPQPMQTPFPVLQTPVQVTPAPMPIGQAPLTQHVPLTPTPPMAQDPKPAIPIETPAAPPAPAPLVEHLQDFDPLLANLTWENRTWRLMAGEITLKDFGRDEGEARRALRLLRDLHLTQHGVLGGGIEYWLSNGHAPADGGTRSLRTVPIDTHTLKAENLHGQWVVRDQQRVLFNFGPAGADNARQALAVVEKYGFTKIGTLGGINPTMLVFTSHNDGTTLPVQHVAMTPPLSPAPGPTPPAPPPPGSPAARLLERNPGATASAPVVAAVAPLHDAYGVPGPNGVNGSNVDPTSVKFDWRQVTLHHDANGWKVAAGSMELANLGANEWEAQRAVQAFQHYHFNELVRCGPAVDNVGYYLVNGLPPRGLLFGVPHETFQTKDVAVRQMGDRYAVCAGDQVLARCGPNPEEARQLANAIHVHGFDQICRLGNGEQSGLSFFVRSR